MVSRQIAEYVYALKYEDFPKQVVARAKDCVRDYLGCVLGAYPVDESRMTAEWVRDLGDRKECTLIGWGHRTSCRNAAFANGYFTEVLEIQDGVSYANCHPASVILPAIFAAAEYTKKGGRDLLTALVAGYEVMIRIAASLPPEKSVGSIKTGPAGTLAAALAVGKLLGLNADQLLDAMGIAGCTLPISSRESVWGPTIKPVLGGQAAKTAVEAALLAQKGFTGCEEILLGTPPRYLGFCNLFSQEPDIGWLTAGLGEKYLIMDVYFKPYAACRLAHSAIEATLALVIGNDIRPEAVDRVEVLTFARSAREVGQRYPEPGSTFITCQFSLPFMVAVIIEDRALGPRQYRREKIADTTTQALAKRVHVSADEALTKQYPARAPARVKIVLQNGTSVEKQVDVPKWEPERGVPQDELLQKFHELAAQVLPEERIHKIDRIIDRLQNLKRVSTLVRQLVI